MNRRIRTRPQLHLERILQVLAVAACLALAGQLAVMLWAHHELTQVESIVGLHTASLATGEGLYYDLNRYPYTVSLYMPVFYLAAGALQRLGLPILSAGRLLSFTGLLGILWLSWQILRTAGCDPYARWAGTLAVASTANLLVWGTVGQVDVLGLCLSLAGLHQYFEYRLSHQRWRLALAGLFVFLALFTKQTFLASGAVIFVLLFVENRPLALRFAAGLGVAGVLAALAVNVASSGRFYDNTVLANLIPFSLNKMFQQFRYLALAGSGLLALAACGLLKPGPGRWHPVFLYLGFSGAVFAATCPRVGADLNYQLEVLVALGLCAGWTLHRLDFFPRFFRGDRAIVTLLHVPLLLHVALNLAITGKTLLARIGLEHMRRQEYAMLRPFLENAQGPVLSVQMDPLVQTARRIEVEPLIYTSLVAGGLVDPEPVRKDLAGRKFGMVLLYENVFEPPLASNLEVPSLPPEQLEEIRKNYRLAARIPGPLLGGDYVYLPLETTEVAQARDQGASSAGLGKIRRPTMGVYQ